MLKRIVYRNIFSILRIKLPLKAIAGRKSTDE